MPAEFIISGILFTITIPLFFRAIPIALANPRGFPSARWGRPEIGLSAGLVAFFFLMAAGSSGQPLHELTLRDIILSGTIYAGLTLFVLGFLVFRGFDIVQIFGLRVGGWNAGTVLGWLLIFLPSIFLIQTLIASWTDPESSLQPIVIFLLENLGWQERMAVMMVAVIAAPLTEELIFRGCLYSVIRSHWGRPIAIFSTSLLFALIHWHVPALPGLMLVGLALALVYERCGSLWAPVVMHASFNALNIIAALLWPDLSK